MADLVLKDRDGTQITYTGVEVVSIPNTEGELEHFLNLETGGIPSGGTDGQVLKKLSETDYDVGWENEVDVTGKADKVTGATADNFASLDANGNIKDSGKKATDFETADDTILKKANVVNDLTTGGIDVPLSAEQGKTLSQDVEILKTDITTNKTDITLLKKEVKDTSKMIAEANPNGEPKATVSGINSVSVPKVATQGGGKVTVEGNTLTPLVAEDYAITLHFDSVLGNKYYETSNKTILTGTGEEMTVDSPESESDIAVFDLNAFGLETLTATECQAMIPNYFTGTKSVTKTRVKSVGKNLFDKSNLEINTYDGYGQPLVNTSRCRTKDFIKVQPSTTYYLSKIDTQSFGINCYAEKDFTTQIDRIVNEASIGKSFTTPANCHYIHFNTNASLQTMLNDNIQLERNPTATAYVPYTSNSVYLAPQELYSLPNGVKDTIDTNGFLTKRDKKDTASGIVAVNTTNYPLAKNGGQFVNYLTADGMEIGIIGTDSTTGAGTLYYELALPVTTPNQATGTLILYPNGQVEIDNGMADGGLYDGGITLLNTAYPIKTLERIQKITDGYAVDIDVSKAVISLDKLSFTHPNLVNGDVIVFEYTYDYEGVNGQATVEYFDSRLVIADTKNGKFYKYKPVITNGVIASWAVEEV